MSLVLQTLLLITIVGFVVATPSLAYKHILVNVCLTSSVIATDLLILDSISFGVQAFIAKYGPTPFKAIIAKDIKVLYA